MLKIALPLFFTALLMADGPVLKTGQTTEYKAGDDGTYKAGTARSYNRVAGVVIDNATGMQWQDDYSDNANTIKTANWADAATYCTSLNLDGPGWRLPSIEELVSITDKSRTNPSIDPTFQNVTSNLYWSSTTYAFLSGYAWGVNFYYGGDGLGAKTSSFYVRCVRGGQPI